MNYIRMRKCDTKITDNTRFNYLQSKVEQGVMLDLAIIELVKKRMALYCFYKFIVISLCSKQKLYPELSLQI